MTKARLTPNDWASAAIAQGQPHAVPRTGPELERYVETLLQILTRR